MLDPDRVFYRTNRCLFELEQFLNFRQKFRRSILLTVNTPTFARGMLKCLTQVGSSTGQTTVWKCFLSATQIQPKRQRKGIPTVSAPTFARGLRKCLVNFLLEVQLLLPGPLLDSNARLLILVFCLVLYVTAWFFYCFIIKWLSLRIPVMWQRNRKRLAISHMLY